MQTDILLDSPDQFRYASERATADSFAGDFCEPSLDQVQRGTAGRRVVWMEAWMVREPLLNRWVLVRSVIVQHQMNLASP